MRERMINTDAGRMVRINGADNDAALALVYHKISSSKPEKDQVTPRPEPRLTNNYKASLNWTLLCLLSFVFCLLSFHDGKTPKMALLADKEAI